MECEYTVILRLEEGKSLNPDNIQPLKPHFVSVLGKGIEIILEEQPIDLRTEPHRKVTQVPGAGYEVNNVKYIDECSVQYHIP